MTTPLPSVIEAWQAHGRRVRVLGHDCFFVDEGPRTDPEPILILHGFPSSGFDFRLALPRLSARRRVILHDHLGFGLSDKPERYSYSLHEQADAALELWRSLGIERGHLLAHDYGTSIATELLARRAHGLLPIGLSSVTLCNGSVHLELAHLTPSQRLLRSPLLGPLFARVARPAIFKAQLRKILGDPAAVSEEELDWMWILMTRDGGKERLPAVSGYLDERVRFRHRWTAALIAFDGPAHVLWGRRDPVAVAAIAERLATELCRARVTWLDRLGHYPMLEDPAAWSDAALAFLDSTPAL
ncbi:MAG TPA: alpha/beta hydrolase [Polyangiaceae bacterium]|jgi:pimeloyl-ACP methyl ester carboxylesterase|nr:alpha/beta hydrolase [Polyangiaceae bacterium]